MVVGGSQHDKNPGDEIKDVKVSTTCSANYGVEGTTPTVVKVIVSPSVIVQSILLLYKCIVCDYFGLQASLGKSL